MSIKAVLFGFFTSDPFSSASSNVSVDTIAVQIRKTVFLQKIYQFSRKQLNNSDGSRQ